MAFDVDTTPTAPHVLHLRMEGVFSEAEMRAFVVAHNAAVDALGTAEYRVFCDIRALRPLSPACAALFESAKAHSASRPNFQGSAVLASGPVVAMQHQRTSAAGGVLDTELITTDEAACLAHLERVRRSRPPAPAAPPSS